jgi:hypothetical protein
MEFGEVLKVSERRDDWLVRKPLRDEWQASDFIFRADYIEGARTCVYTSNDVHGVTDSLFGVVKKPRRAGKMIRTGRKPAQWTPIRRVTIHVHSRTLVV